MTAPHLTRLLTCLDPAARLTPHLDWIEPLLKAARATAREAWPVLELEVDAFDSVLLERLLRSEGGDEALRRWFEHLHPADLYLASCCAAYSPGATEAFKELFSRDIDTLTRRFADDYHTRDDLEQHLFEALFVGERARIKEYSGQGFLLNWLRITTVRLFIDLQRSRRTPHRELVVEDDELARALDEATTQDVEVAYLKHTYRATFRRAFAQATSRLSPHHKTLLRQHVIERRSIDQLGQLYGVHRATAARRLELARQQLFEETRAILLESFEVTPHELDSILAMIASQLDASVERLLGEEEG